MGDFIKGKQLAHLPEGVQQGIALHRAIDKFTDNHVAVQALKPLLSAKRQRFSGIISDIVFDHLLAAHWQEYSEISINKFAQQHYQLLTEHLTIMPETMQSMVKRMVERNWLARYDCLTTTGLAIDAVSERIRFKNNLSGAMTEVLANYDAYQNAFKQFFPQLVEFSQQAISAQNLSYKATLSANKHQ